VLQLISRPPATAMEPVTDILHGVPVVDPYRWLEEQASPRTRQWIDEQTKYARLYLDRIPNRAQIQARVRQFLAVETYDSLQKANGRYFFRKRLPNQEQPCICMREGPHGHDQLLLDPSALGQGDHVAAKPLRVSTDGRYLLYEIKKGGERSGTFAILEIDRRRTLPDILPRGFLRGFAFAPDCRSFYYSYEALNAKPGATKSISCHTLGTDFSQDEQIFRVPGGSQVRLGLISDIERFGILVYSFGAGTRITFYLQNFNTPFEPERILSDVDYSFAPVLANGRLFAATDRDAPNMRIVEINRGNDGLMEWTNLVPEAPGRIQQWLVLSDRLLASYFIDGEIQIRSFSLEGKPLDQIDITGDETVRWKGVSAEKDEIFLESESFSHPPHIFCYSPKSGERTAWQPAADCLKSPCFEHERVFFRTADGTSIPIFLVGKPEALAERYRPTIMTSYGGYGMSMSPQFSVLASVLMERGCLFALPNIRGGAEFGAEWHEAARRRRRQTAYDDFLAAAEWLIETGRTAPGRLAIFGGSNSGLLVGAVMTQRPELFRAVICMVPLLDMLRYHLFDGAYVWRDEFGTSEDPEDFAVLLRYSPYHHVQDGIKYPATLIVSGDADQNCNPLHARKMTARLQSANSSNHPILLHYSAFRGHSPVLPLSERIEALTDRVAFLCEELGLSQQEECS